MVTSSIARRELPANTDEQLLDFIRAIVDLCGAGLRPDQVREPLVVEMRRAQRGRRCCEPGAGSRVELNCNESRIS
jgi:hypothetical protein